MTKWLELLGYSVGYGQILQRSAVLKSYQQTDLGRLNVIYIAGTNREGSTYAYISSILQNFGCKVGLYTSLYLLSIRERIRINSKPIEEDDFTIAFFEV